MHGTGNDYVYVNCMEQELPNPGAISEYISHRRFGIGSDGLIMICKSDVADFKMRIFNADASEAKMCGNGSRCIAKYVYDKGLTDKTTFTLETLSGIKTIDVFLGADGKVAEASVDMGEPIFKCTEIPMISDHFMFVDQGLVIEEDVVYNGTAISVGNPHFVTFVEDVDALDLENWDRNLKSINYFRKASTQNLYRSLIKIPLNSASGNVAAAKPGPAVQVLQQSV